LALITKAVQLRKFVYAWKLISGKFDNADDDGEITHFQALSAALSATIGTGNIAGVGTAIALGGPGAVFWMWVTAVFGMGLKYAECLLALKFRTIHNDGTVGAGPMYYLEKGLGQKWLGISFAVFATIASFGIGNMVQANSVAEPVLNTFGIPKLVTGLIISALVFAVIVGGIKRIGQVASRLVPFMAVFYVGGGIMGDFYKTRNDPFGICHDIFRRIYRQRRVPPLPRPFGLVWPEVFFPMKQDSAARPLPTAQPRPKNRSGKDWLPCSGRLLTPSSSVP